MVALDDYILLSTDTHRFVSLAVNIHRNAILKALRRQSNIKISSLSTEGYALTAVESHTLDDIIITQECTANLIIINIDRGISKHHRSILSNDEDITSDLLAIVTLERDRLNNLAITLKLQLEPATSVLQRELLIVAHSNHRRRAYAITVCDVLLHSGKRSLESI